MITKDQLKQTLQDLRSRVAVERNAYARSKQLLELYFPVEWAVVEQAHRSIGLYLKNEAVRSKHNLAQYMMGLSEEGGYGEEPLVPALEELIRAVPGVLESLSKAKRSYDSAHEDAIKSEERLVHYNEVNGQAEQLIVDIKNATEELEDKIYGDG